MTPLEKAIAIAEATKRQLGLGKGVSNSRLGSIERGNAANESDQNALLQQVVGALRSITTNRHIDSSASRDDTATTLQEYISGTKKDD